jgi:hypothetical protein
MFNLYHVIYIIYILTAHMHRVYRVCMFVCMCVCVCVCMHAYMYGMYVCVCILTPHVHRVYRVWHDRAIRERSILQGVAGNKNGGVEG